MGKKYIIELESGTHMFVLGPEGIVHIGEPDVVYETVDGMEIGDAVINAKPYTEPDLDAIRNEAYEKGVQDTKQHWVDAPRSCAYKLGYENGLNDAWEAARKIIHMPEGDLLNIFTECYSAVCTALQVLLKYDAAEAIEKLKAYEQEKEKSEELKKEQSFTAEEVMRQYLDTFCKERYCTGCPLYTPDFTCGRGKHFLHDCVSDEEVRRAYVAVIQKMKEES